MIANNSKSNEEKGTGSSNTKNKKGSDTSDKVEVPDSDEN